MLKSIAQHRPGTIYQQLVRPVERSRRAPQSSWNAAKKQKINIICFVTPLELGGVSSRRDGNSPSFYPLQRAAKEVEISRHYKKRSRGQSAESKNSEI